MDTGMGTPTRCVDGAIIFDDAYLSVEWADSVRPCDREGRLERAIKACAAAAHVGQYAADLMRKKGLRADAEVSEAKAYRFLVVTERLALYRYIGFSGHPGGVMGDR